MEIEQKKKTSHPWTTEYRRLKLYHVFLLGFLIILPCITYSEKCRDWEKKYGEKTQKIECVVEEKIPGSRVTYGGRIILRGTEENSWYTREEHKKQGEFERIEVGEIRWVYLSLEKLGKAPDKPFGLRVRGLCVVLIILTWLITGMMQFIGVGDLEHDTSPRLSLFDDILIITWFLITIGILFAWCM